LDSTEKDWWDNAPGETNFFYDGLRLHGTEKDQAPGISEIKSGKPSYAVCSKTPTHYSPLIDMQNYDANSQICARTILGRFSVVE
jgi:hypothetical protein